MSVPCHCPYCGDVVGVKNHRGGKHLVPRRYKGIWNKKAPCKGNHDKPVEEIVGKTLAGLITVERTRYPDGSCTPEVNQYTGSTEGWQFMLLVFYVKVLRNPVRAKGWIWPFSSMFAIREGILGSSHR